MLSVPDTHLDSTHHRGHNSTRSSADVQLVTEIVHTPSYVE